MVNLQYLTEPAHIPLSSHQKHSLSRALLGRGRDGWSLPVFLCRDITRLDTD